MSDENLVDFYKLLELSRSASAAEIEAACLRVGASLRSNIEIGEGGAEEQFKLVEKAFETLTNPESRAAYDHRLSASTDRTINAALESAPPPHKREGILVMAASISVAAIVVAAALVIDGSISLATFHFLPYESGSVYYPIKSYLIELDAPIALLLCFLVFIYGLLAFLAVLPRPSVLWRRLTELWAAP